MSRRFLLSLLSLALVQCGDSGGPSDGPALSANIVEVIQGDGQVDTVGQQLPVPIRIVVLDTAVASGAPGAMGSAAPPTPVPGQLVNFVVVSGGGSVFAGAALTDSAGHAQELWTLGGSAGTQCLEARAVDQETGEPITFAQVCATGVPGPMTQAGFTIDSARVFGDTTFLVPAFARDAFNNSVPLPAIANLDSGVTLTPEASSYRVAFQRAGLTRLAMNGDTLYLYAFHPRGRYRWTRHWDDTTWVETGRLVGIASPPPGQSCPSGLNPPAGTARFLAVDSLMLVRTVGGAAPDTLVVGASGAGAAKACSLANAGLTNPLRPQDPPEYFDLFRQGKASAGDGQPGGYMAFAASMRIGRFSYTYTDIGGPIVDSLWLGQP